jgi:hypothetical protein
MGTASSKVGVNKTAPPLWRFPLNATKPSLSVPASYENYEEPGPRGSAANFFKPPLANLIESPAGPIMPSPVPPLAATLMDQIHPSQGVLTIDTAGQACSFTYMYGAVQAMALASLSSKTPFDP